MIAVRVSEHPWSELRGLRSPGTGFPGLISLCTRRGDGIHDFAAVYGLRRAVVVDTFGADFDRLGSITMSVGWSAITMIRGTRSSSF